MKRLTKAEEDVMQIIWELEPCLVSDILQYMVEQQGQEKPPHSTISSIVRILEKKGFVQHKAYGRTYEYSALISREAYSRSSIRKLASDYFGGSMSKLVSFLVKEENLSDEERQQMLDLLNNPPKEES